MEAWRICRRRYADLSGEGARLAGGRWNRRGTPVVYLAEHPALAVLEVLVHLDLPPELLPDDYVLLRAELPFRAAEFEPTEAYNPETVGNAWLRAGETPLLRVSSVLVAHAKNFLLNPAHRTAARAKIVSVEKFVFDPRFRLFPV
jgi:RES domain-containing protein